MKAQHIFLSAALLLLLVSGANAQVSEAEFQALKAFYHTTGGDRWYNKAGWEHINTTATKDDVTSAWNGITVTDGHITRLELYSNNLTGYLPPQIGDLSWLTRLSLYSNNIGGAIPEEIGNLTSLTLLELANNKLISPVPATLANLSKLMWLQLQNNPLQCEFPGGILAQMPGLFSVDLSSCGLTGHIEDIFDNLPLLRSFSVGSNKLSGEVPPSLSRLKQLSEVHLRANMFSGNLPDFSDSPDMYYLTMGQNQFTGTIPETYGNFSKLQFFHAENNQLTGPIPQGMFSDILRRFWIENNYFTFEGLEPVYQKLMGVGQRTFTTNKLFPLHESMISVNEGEPLVLNAASLSVYDMGGNNNRYKWFRNNQEVYSGNNPAYSVAATTDNDAGIYRFEVTNTVVDNIVFKSVNILVSVKAEGNSAPTDIQLSKTEVEENYSGIVGTLSATDPDPGDTHVFSLIEGDGINDRDNFRFSVNGNQLRIDRPANFELQPSLNIVVMANDLKGGLFIKPFVIEVIDVDEPPYFSGQITQNTIDETAPNGTTVFTLLAFDPEGQPVSFSITGGNEDGAFRIEGNRLVVADNTQFNYDLKSQYILQVEASDGELTTGITLYVSLSKINSMPTIENATFYIDENSPEGTVVGEINASDPEGDELSFSILSGNIHNAFRLEENKIVVNNQAVIDYEEYPTFILIINVTDGISHIQGTFTINLNNLPDETGNDILTFSIPDPLEEPVIHTAQQAITAVVIDYDLVAVPVTFTISKGASANPPSGSTMNLITPKNIVVTSETGVAKTWLVDISDITATNDAAMMPVSVFPNPATDRITVSGVAGNVTVSIMDVMGKVLIKKHLSLPEEPIDVGHLSPGLYIIVLETGGPVQVRKLSKY